MKKLITIIAVIISLNASAQKDTSAPKTITDTSNICLSVSDINRYLQPLGDQLNYNQYQQLLQVLSYFIATKQKELATPKKK